MALRARLSAPREERNDWPWHQAKWTAMSASLLFGGERRFEASNYLKGGYAIRLAIETRKVGWTQIGKLAKVTQPPRTKATLVSPGFGTPFLIASQVFQYQPQPRKWLAVERLAHAEQMFVKTGDILVRRSADVGKGTIAFSQHERHLISDHFFRVDPRQELLRGWLYAYLRASQTRAMMNAAQYGHIIKHLEVGHLNALPVLMLRDSLLDDYSERVKVILDYRNRAHVLTLAAEAHLVQCLGPMTVDDNGESGFSTRASETLFSGRRRFDALPHNPAVRSIRQHLAQNGKGFIKLSDAGYKVWLPTRFKRIPAADGIELMDSSSLYEVNPEPFRNIAEVDFGDPL